MDKEAIHEAAKRARHRVTQEGICWVFHREGEIIGTGSAEKAKALQATGSTAELVGTYREGVCTAWIAEDIEVAMAGRDERGLRL